MDDGLAKFAIWFMGEIVGLWIVWSSFMAIRFMVEVAQHQHASFVVHGGQAGGVAIVIPILASVFGSLIWSLVILLD